MTRLLRPGLAMAIALVGCGRLGFGDREELDPDAATPDVAPPGPDASTFDLCADVDPATVALYRFDAAAGRDETGRHPGTARGDASLRDGACGAMALATGANGYVLVADSPAFDLPVGSVEVQIRTPPPTGMIRSIFARDALGTQEDGHLTVLMNEAGELLVRVQQGGVSYFRCAAPPPPDVWIHIGVSFGAPGLAMWIDGVLATLPSVSFRGELRDCTLPTTAGMTGNNNALVIGATNALAPDGDPDPAIDEHFDGGVVDQLHMRATWLDFTRP